MPKITVNDISMYYESYGEGFPVFFIGGFSVDHNAWRGVIDKFKSKYRVLVCDNRGVGQTDAPDGPYSVDQMADDIAALCAKIGVEQAHFVGNSMGGLIAQVLALRHPELVKTAVLSNCVSYINTPFFYFLKAQYELLRANAPKEGLIKSACSWIYSYQFLSQPDALDLLVQLELENPYPFSIRGFAGQLSAVEHFDSREWVHQIKAPMLVLGSDQDLVFPESAVKSLSQQIPNAQYYCFKNCGHLPFIEHRDLFAQVVLEFIYKS